MNDKIDKFIDLVRTSIAHGSFIKLTLGNYKGPDEHLQKIQVRLITTKKGTRLYFVYRGDTRDTAKNLGLDEGVEAVGQLLENQFFSAHLFTLENDIQLEIGKRNKSRLNLVKPTFRSPPPKKHDRQKQRMVDGSAFYLKALGITSDEGKVRDRAQDKWRQINKFVEIIDGLVSKSGLADSKTLRIADMGCGKGYLTFALYDHFTAQLGMTVDITGVEVRPELVQLGNDIARSSEFTGLRFLQGSIADHDIGHPDILIALHACDTATDEAIFRGIRSGASLIVVAPCCHQELRPQIRAPEMLKNVLKHGIMLERTGEFVTDALRSLLLERSGYSIRLLDFVPLEHTPKNLMLVGTRSVSPPRALDIDRQIAQLKDYYSIKTQRLEALLQNRRAVPG